MIKSLAFFPSQCARNGAPVVHALLRSLERYGVTAIQDSWQADAVLIWSVLWSGRMAPNSAVYEHYKNQGKPVIVAEVGALRRGQTWKVARDNIDATGYYGHHLNLDPDRPARLGLRWHHPTRSAHVLIACQHTGSLQMQACPNQIQWALDSARLIRSLTDRAIVIRPHPRSPMDINPNIPGVTMQLPKRIDNTYDDFDIDLACHLVINFNSGPGIQAPFWGTPVIVDRTSLASPVGINYTEIESPPHRDLHQWAIEISHTEYLMSEIEAGVWFTRLGLDI